MSVSRKIRTAIAGLGGGGGIILSDLFDGLAGAYDNTRLPDIGVYDANTLMHINGIGDFVPPINAQSVLGIARDPSKNYRMTTSFITSGSGSTSYNCFFYMATNDYNIFNNGFCINYTQVTLAVREGPTIIESVALTQNQEISIAMEYYANGDWNVSLDGVPTWSGNSILHSPDTVIGILNDGGTHGGRLQKVHDWTIEEI